MINTIMILFLLVIEIFLLLICLYTFFKLRNVHLFLYHFKNEIGIQHNNLYKQFESFLGLQLDLGFDKSLPFTRDWACSPDFLLTVSRAIAEKKPEVVVECSSGVSTIVLAKGLANNGFGHVYSIDHDKFYADKTYDELVRHGLESWVTIIHGPLVEYKFDNKEYFWYSLNDYDKSMMIDMLIIDGPPRSVSNFARYPASQLMFNNLKPSGIVFLDDSNREDEKIIVKRWLSEYKNFSKTEIECEKGCVMLSL